MKHFLQKLASRVMQPEPSLHPFVESIYAARATVDGSPRSVEMAVGVARPQVTPSPPVPTAEMQWRGSMPTEREERPPYRPLLPPRQTEEPGAEAVAPLRRNLESSREEHVSAVESTRGEGYSAASSISEREAVRGIREAQIAGPPKPLVPRIDAQLSRAMSRPTAPPVGPRHHQEVRGADDIQINIGRIEVIAVPPAAPRTTAPPARKGMSLDDYLSRRNGRMG